MVGSDKRKDINVSTLLKIKEFLLAQHEPIYKSEIVKQIGVDYDSLNYAIDVLKIRDSFMYDITCDDEGRILLCWN